jgi:hypothetical protein
MQTPGNARDALCRDVVRGHVGHPPYAPYPHRARTPRRRSDRRSMRSASGDSPMSSVASGPRQVALIHRPAHRPWRAIGCRSGTRRRPCPRPLHACKWHRRDPTYPQPTFRALISQPPVAPRAHVHQPEPPLFRHWRRRCAPPSSRSPHPRKLLNPSLCVIIAPRAAC